jgi:hypothetical protein
MNTRILTGVLSATLMLAPFALAQDKAATPDPATPAPDAAMAEAKRQGRVALKPTAESSPTQSIRQAVAFERYKELAAEREARKESRSSNADRTKQ